MEIIITFFRDVLNGPAYIVVAIISGILICSCIGYLAEKKINEKKERSKYVQIDNSHVNPAPQVTQAQIPQTQVAPPAVGVMQSTQAPSSEQVNTQNQ